MSTLLQALDAHVAALTKVGSTVPFRLRPGLSLEEIVRLTAPLPYELPPELVALYQWHDGTATDGIEETSAFVPAGDFVTLAEAVQVYEEWVEVADEMAAPDLPAERLWDRSAFPVFPTEFGAKAMWVALCDTPGPETGCGFWAVENGELRPVYPSLTSMIEDTTAALASRAVQFDAILGINRHARSRYHDHAIKPWPPIPGRGG